MDIAPGQTHDAKLLEPVLDATTERVVVDEVVADKAFDGDAQRTACVNRDIFPNIPNKSNRTWLWPFIKKVYRERNRIERLIGKAKQFRRFATRYEKLREMFRGVVHLVLGFIRLRRIVNVNTA